MRDLLIFAAQESFMSKKTSIFIENARTIARAIKTSGEEAGEVLSLSQAYERYARSHGFRTWGAMRASANGGQTLQIPVKEPETLHVHPNPPLGPIERWAFTQQVNDVLLRTTLYERLDRRVVRLWLAKFFPKGTASDEIARRADALQSHEEDIITHIIDQLASEIEKIVITAESQLGSLKEARASQKHLLLEEDASVKEPVDYLDAEADNSQFKVPVPVWKLRNANLIIRSRDGDMYLGLTDEEKALRKNWLVGDACLAEEDDD
jgi:hypothetical protein